MLKTPPWKYPFRSCNSRLVCLGCGGGGPSWLPRFRSWGRVCGPFRRVCRRCCRSRSRCHFRLVALSCQGTPTLFSGLQTCFFRHKVAVGNIPSGAVGRGIATTVRLVVDCNDSRLDRILAWAEILTWAVFSVGQGSRLDFPRK